MLPKIEFIGGRYKNDPEKAVLPAIMWTSAFEDSTKVYGLFFGWWDWAIGVMWSFSKQST